MIHNDNASSALTRFSLDRRITVLVLFLSLIVVGAIATVGIPQELFPSGFEDNYLNVRANWGDAPPQEVLEKVTIPLEDELSTVKGLENIYSYSGTSISNIGMTFKQGVDMDVAYREVRDRVERARLLFPEGIDRPTIRKHDASGFPIYFLGLAIDPTLSDYYQLVQKEVILPLSRIDGVATVDTNGLAEKEIIIEVDRDALESAGLNLYELGQELGRDNFTMASGQVHDAGKKYFLRSIAEYKNLEDLQNRWVAPNVKLQDVAKIKYEEAEKRFQVRVNSRPAVALAVMKEGQANTVATSQAVDEVVEELKLNPRLQHIYMEKLFSQGDIITESIDNLVDNGKVGAIFAFFVLLFFLRRLRLTLIITLSIPISLLIALTVMYFMGESLNILTLLGLVICVGLLVDNSVVVAENIQRHFSDENTTKRQACLRGAGEIALAIVMATLTTVTVFLPVSLVEGKGQFFLLRLSIPISVSLMASLVIALVFVPLSVYLTVGNPNDEHHSALYMSWRKALRKVYDATLGRINKWYVDNLRFFLKHRADLTVVLFLVFLGTIAITQEKVKFNMSDEEEQRQFNIYVETDPQINYDDIKEFFVDAEKVLEDNKEKFHLDGYLMVNYRGGGRLEGWLVDDLPRGVEVKTIVKEVAEMLPERPGFEFFYGQEDTTNEDSGTSQYLVTLNGENPEQLVSIADQLKEQILKFPGVIGLQKSEDDSPNEMALVIDRDRLSSSNVNPQTLAGVVGFALRGQMLPKYNDNGREVPVRIRFQEKDREQLSDLQTFFVPTEEGDLTSVGALTKTKMLNSAKGISRRNKKTSQRLSFDLDKEEKGTSKLISAYLAQYDLPEGVQFSDPTARRTNEELANMLKAGLLSLVFIYMLMAFLFESIWLPFSIMFTIPLAIIGVLWAHIIGGMSIDMLGIVAIILLIGVVVNNGIVLVDYVHRLRDEGHDRNEALLLAAKRRFRPIVMTALTTIIGMVPLTISKASSIGLSYKSFGVALIGGMTTATILTMLVVPVFYTFFDDLRNNLMTWWFKLWGKVPAETATASVEQTSP